MDNKKFSLITLILTLILFVAGWVLTYYSIFGGGGGLSKWSVTAGCFFLALLFLYLFILVTKEARTILLLVLVIFLPALILGKGHWISMFLPYIFSVLVAILATKLIKVEQNSRVKINTFHILRRGIFTVGTALSILIASGFYFSVIDKKEAKSNVPSFNFEISKKMAESGMKVVETVVPSKEITWISEGVTVDEYLEKAMKKGREREMELLFQSSEFDKNEFIIQSREEFSNQLGVKLAGNEKMIDVIRGLVNRKIDEVVNGEGLTADMMPFTVAIAMFLVVKSFAWVINLLLLWTIALVFYILSKLKIVKITEVQRTVEEVL